MKNFGIKSEKSYENLFIPVAFILGIVPLIVRLICIKPNAALINLYGNQPLRDLFSQRKALFLTIFTVILIVISIIFCKKIFKKKDKIVNSILIAAGIFLFLTLLSAMFSSYKDTVFFGIYDRAEGLITITCYMIIFVYSIYTFKNTNNYKYIIIPILVVVVINSFLGLFQYVGQDLIKSDLGKAIVIPSEYNVTPTFQYESGKLYGTLFHYDYVGSFVAIVLPILFCFAIFEDYEIAYKILAGMGSLLSIWLLLGSSSRAGIVGVVVSIILGIVIFGKLISKRKKPFVICLSVFIFIAIAINFATSGKALSRIPSLMSDALSVFKDSSDFDYRQYAFIKNIEYTDNGVNVMFQKDMLKISFENNQYVFKNSNNEILDFQRADKVYTTADPNFSDVSIQYSKSNMKATRADQFIINIKGQPAFTFKLKEDNTIHLINPQTGSDMDTVFPETSVFNGKEKLGSSRGYIWGRTIPLLKNHIILGSGPDTFIYQFPQNDLIGKYYAYDTTNMVVDKPHDLYLQIASNEGVVALLAFLVIMIIYIVDSFKLYALKNEYEKEQILGAATCLGVVGYLAAGLFNDSIISVAPIFWIVLGVGVALNFINRQKIKNN